MKLKWKQCVSAILIGMVMPLLLVPLFKIPQTDLQENPKKTESADATNDSSGHAVLVLDQQGTVKEFELDEYLVGVVLCEMPAEFEDEALKAQAVVARTYTLKRQQEGNKHAIADVCMNSGCCQGYTDVSGYIENGGAKEAVDKIENAVKMTQNQVVLYDGALIEATYFSCSGGMTEDASAVWGSDLPYLKATESPGEEKAAHYMETIQLSTSAFQEKLGLGIDGTPGTWIQQITYTAGGGVDTIRIGGIDYKGTDIRQKLGLRSTAFVLSVVGDTVTITTKGFGHRVGMSQYGADAMAVQGHDYKEILQHYYEGITIEPYNLNN